MDADEQLNLGVKTRELCKLLDDMTSSMSSVREVIKSIRHEQDLSTKDGISLLSLKHQLLLFYLQSLVILSSRRALGHTLAPRTPPTQPFSDSNRDVRGADAGDLVDFIVESRVVLEKIKPLEARMRYQIEKLVRLAQEPEKSTQNDIIDDPLAFRPNPQNLLNADDHSSGSDEEDGDDGPMNTASNDGIYRPPRLAPVPYTAVPKSKSKRSQPVPTTLRSLQDPSIPHVESTSGLGNTPALLSSRAKHLKRLEEFEEENFGRVVLSKRERRRRERDEEDMAMGAELGGGGGVGRNRRRGGLEDEFGDVLRNVERGASGARSGNGDGYEELRRSAKKKGVLERTRMRGREEAFTEDDEPGESRMRKRSRFELETKNVKKKLGRK